MKEETRNALRSLIDSGTWYKNHQLDEDRFTVFVNTAREQGDVNIVEKDFLAEFGDLTDALEEKAKELHIMYRARIDH